MWNHDSNISDLLIFNLILKLSNYITCAWKQPSLQNFTESWQSWLPFNHFNKTFVLLTLKAACKGACIVPAPEVGFEWQELSRCFFTRMKVVFLFPCLQQPSLFSVKRLCKVGMGRKEGGIPAFTHSLLPWCTTPWHMQQPFPRVWLNYIFI